jgi:hypothetical protein
VCHASRDGVEQEAKGNGSHSKNEEDVLDIGKEDEEELFYMDQA